MRVWDGVEGLEWGVGVGVCGWGLRVPCGGLGRFYISLPFLPTFHLCHYYCHFYRATFTCAIFTDAIFTQNHIYFMKKNSGEYLNSFRIVSIFYIEQSTVWFDNLD